MEIDLKEKKRIGKAISDAMTNTTMRGDAFFVEGCDVAIKELTPHFVEELLADSTLGEAFTVDEMSAVDAFLEKRRKKYAPEDPVVSLAEALFFRETGVLVGSDAVAKVVKAIDEARGRSGK